MRSTNDETGRGEDQLDWVGGRQRQAGLPEQGGGYLDICSSRSFKKKRARVARRDPRLDELRELGLGYRWLRIAERIGVDLFLEVWEILDEENAELPAGEREPTRVRIPLFAGWRRLQRNRYIRALAGRGHRPAEIRRILIRETCERLTERHISRIISAASDDID